MATVADFLRRELAAIRAMDQYRKSLTHSMDFAIPQIALPRDVLAESGIQSLMRDALEQNRRVADSIGVLTPLMRPAFRATEAITSLLEATRPIRDQIAGMELAQRRWRDLIAPGFESFALPALQNHLAGVARIAETSRMVAAMLSIDKVGLAFPVTTEFRADLVTGFGELTRAYGSFYEGVGDSLLALPPAATARPATEYFNAVDLLETTTGETVEQEAEGEIETVRAQISAETEDALSASLTGRFPDLITLIQGARAAFTSRHADYERHFITSLRELFNHVLHRLAPDDEVRKFSTDGKDFPDGRPTRNVRLRYICRAVNDGRFAKFVEKDVAAAVALVELFNGGTHEVVCSYTQVQCRALMARAEGLVRFLLEISECE